MWPSHAVCFRFGFFKVTDRAGVREVGWISLTAEFEPPDTPPNKSTYGFGRPTLPPLSVILSFHGILPTRLPSSCYLHPLIFNASGDEGGWGGGILVPTVPPIVHQQQKSYLHLYLLFLGLKMAASDETGPAWPPKTGKSPCLSTSLTRWTHTGK